MSLEKETRGWVDGGLVKLNLFIGTVFEDQNGNSYLLTPDLDFVDKNLDTVDLDKTKIKSVGPHRIDDWDVIRGDFEINGPYYWWSTGHMYDIHTRYNDPDLSFMKDQKRFLKYTYNRDMTIHRAHGSKYQEIPTLREADIIDFGKVKDKKDKKASDSQKFDDLRDRIQYKWLITFNNPGANELKILGYYPQKLWIDKKLDVKQSAKQYLTNMAKDYKVKGGLIMWRLDNRVGKKPDRLFDEGETVDVGEVDASVSGDYNPYSIKHVDSHLRLVHY